MARVRHDVQMQDCYTGFIQIVTNISMPNLALETMDAFQCSSTLTWPDNAETSQCWE